MKVRYSPDFYRQYKKANVRIRSSVDERIGIFVKDPNNSQLNNHPLQDPYQGYRSIDITADYRAFYQEIDQGEEPVAYFSILGTHSQLYKKQNK